MALSANYKIQWTMNVTPIEEAVLEDGTDKIRAVHSEIDRTFGSSMEADCGTTAANVRYKSYPTTSVAVDLEDATIFNDAGLGVAVDFIYIKIAGAGAGTEDDAADCLVTLDGTVFNLYLKGVGDSMIIRPATSVSMDDVQLKSTTGTADLSVLDIIIAKIA